MRTLTYTEAKDLLKMTDKETVQAFINEEENYDNTYRILTEEEAREEVKNMYIGDAYMLGNFNASFLYNYVPVDMEIVEMLQQKEAFEALGQMVINTDTFDAMMEDYISADGYGHALNSYDGNNEEYSTKEDDLIIFRQN